MTKDSYPPDLTVDDRTIASVDRWYAEQEARRTPEQIAKLEAEANIDAPQKAAAEEKYTQHPPDETLESWLSPIRCEEVEGAIVHIRCGMARAETTAPKYATAHKFAEAMEHLARAEVALAKTRKARSALAAVEGASGFYFGDIFDRLQEAVANQLLDAEFPSLPWQHHETFKELTTNPLAQFDRTIATLEAQIKTLKSLRRRGKPVDNHAICVMAIGRSVWARIRYHAGYFGSDLLPNGRNGGKRFVEDFFLVVLPDKDQATANHFFEVAHKRKLPDIAAIDKARRIAKEQRAAADRRDWDKVDPPGPPEIELYPPSFFMWGPDDYFSSLLPGGPPEDWYDAEGRASEAFEKWDLFIQTDFLTPFDLPFDDPRNWPPL